MCIFGDFLARNFAIRVAESFCTIKVLVLLCYSDNYEKTTQVTYFFRELQKGVRAWGYGVMDEYASYKDFPHVPTYVVDLYRVKFTTLSYIPQP